MPGFLTVGTVLEHLFPLFQEPRITDVVLFCMLQLFFPLGSGYGQAAARAGGFRGPMSGETANKGPGSR